MADPKVSVVMSVYNGERFLREAVESILNQTFTDFEFIIIDDGSTGSTRKILQDYAQGDNRIRIVSQQHAGLTRSLNRGIFLARGEWIARQDADDISHKDRLRLQMEFLGNNPNVGVLGTFAKVIDAEGNVIQIVEHELIDADIRAQLLRDSSFSHGSVVFSKRIFQQVGGYDEDIVYSQDYDLWCRMSRHTDLANLPLPLYSWRNLETNISNVRTREQAQFRDQISVRHCSRLIRERLAALNVGEDGCAILVDVSAVVCTRNRHDDVIRCICSVLSQDRIPREIVVVDSSDDTGLESTIGELFPGQNRGIVARYIRATPGLTHQRNVGVRGSAGAILLFLDDDVILYNGFVREILKVFQERPENIGGVMGNVVNVQRNEGLGYRIAGLFFGYSYGDGRFRASGAATWPYGLPKLMEVEFLCGGQTAYRRQVCEEFGFDENIFSDYCLLEDVEFSYRVSRRYKNYYCPKARCFHNNPSPPSRSNPGVFRQMLLESHTKHFQKNVPKDALSRTAFFLFMFYMRHQQAIEALVGLLFRIRRRLLDLLAVAIGPDAYRKLAAWSRQSS